MLNANKLRISLALVTLTGALHLDRAHATEAASTPDCTSYALGYAAGMCAAKGQKPVGVEYTCNADGTANIVSIYCITPT